jgi:triphosphoribosyl-dephospho-CoA synthase
VTDSDDRAARPRRGPAANAELALLLEVAGTPKPGNVDRERDLTDLHFEQFLAGAVGARPGLKRATRASFGEAFETAVAGMSQQDGGNTQFGCLLLLVPLVAATVAADGDAPTRESVRRVCAGTDTADAVGFYRAFEHVDVAVADPPAGMEPLDVRRGADAVPALRERGVTMAELMADAAPHDANAREWTEGFPRTFRAADRIVADDGPVTDRAARAFLDLLAEAPDTLVATEHGEEVAHELSVRAAEMGDLDAARRWAEELVDRGINPGTTADLTAAALYVALARGVSP